MTNKLRSSLPLFSTRLTATVSVTLVLLIVGLTALLGFGARAMADDIRSHMGFAMVMDEDATPAQINALKQRFTAAPYVDSYTFSAPEQVMDRWQQLLGDDENIAELMDGINPFAPEFEVNVKPRWAAADSLERIADNLEMLPGVAEVKVHTDMIRRVNSTITTVALIAAALAAILLTISFVLINNTVRLTIYSRRFTIYTMKLVGATAGFIRRPIIRANVLAGIIAALTASAILAAVLAWAHKADPTFAAAISWTDAAMVFGGLTAVGALICLSAAAIATNKYIRSNFDEMFR